MTLSDLKPLKDLPFAGVLMPTITIEPAHKTLAGAEPDCSNAEFLKQLCRVGFRQKLDHLTGDRRKEYGDRVTFELDTILTLGFVDYILSIYDICRFADDAGIPRGPGRGSVGSSLVCYLIGIVEIDPIAEELYFTRFMSKARAKSVEVDGVTYMDGGLVPDVDMDFDSERRHEIMEYVERRYPNQTCKTLTTGTLASKMTIIDVMKVYENATKEVAQAAADLLRNVNGPPEGLHDALYHEKPEKRNAAFIAWAADHVETVQIALAIEGLNRSEGVHASAILICAYPIADLIPLQTATDDDGERYVVSGFDMYSAQELVLKFDILGLKNLGVIADVCKQVGIKRTEIDVHSPAIYRQFQDFHRRYGIFQLETFAQGNAAAQVKPRDFKQLAAVLAIARPGAFAHISRFVRYVNEDIYEPINPLIDDIIKPYGGVALYQELYLAMLVRVGLTPDEAETARKVLGKKQKEKVPEVKAKISEVCKRNGHPAEVVDLLLQIAEDSGGYAFAKCLSPDTVVETPDGYRLLHQIEPGQLVKAYDVDRADDHFVEVKDVYESETELYEVEFEDGHKVCCSMDHKLLCSDGVMRTLESVLVGDHQVVTD